MDRLAALQTFVRVVERGSFSAVARELGTTQSAVSKQLAALERHLGSPLLARSTRQLALTDAGRQALEQARRVVAEMAELEGTLAQGRTALAGELRVAASVGFARLHLLPLVRQFLAEHPGVRIDLRLHDGFVDLIEQGIDVAVRIGELGDSGLIARRAGQAQRRLVAHRDYLRQLPAGVKPPREPEDLLAHRCIVYTELQSGHAWTFVAGPGADAPVGSRRTVRVTGPLQTNSSEVIRSAALTGMGIVYAPDWLLHDALARGEVEVLLPDWAPPPSPVHLVSPPERRQSARVRAFVDFVVAGLAELFGAQ